MAAVVAGAEGRPRVALCAGERSVGQSVPDGSKSVKIHQMYLEAKKGFTCTEKGKVDKFALLPPFFAGPPFKPGASCLQSSMYEATISSPLYRCIATVR